MKTRWLTRKSEMYYFAKLIQFGAMAMIAMGFLLKFPELMDPKLFMAGIIIFLVGWTMEKTMLK